MKCSFIFFSTCSILEVDAGIDLCFSVVNVTRPTLFIETDLKSMSHNKDNVLMSFFTYQLMRKE